jgi:hypothetical protein
MDVAPKVIRLQHEPLTDGATLRKRGQDETQVNGGTGEEHTRGLRNGQA